MPGSTLIHLDGIHDCPCARSALKLFTMDGRYDVIASGSSMGILGRRRGRGDDEPPPVLPAGYEEHLTLRSMDFEEFLWANSFPQEAIDGVQFCKKFEIITSRDC